jgi:hypothetical protein
MVQCPCLSITRLTKLVTCSLKADVTRALAKAFSSSVHIKSRDFAASGSKWICVLWIPPRDNDGNQNHAAMIGQTVDFPPASLTFPPGIAIGEIGYFILPGGAVCGIECECAIIDVGCGRNRLIFVHEVKLRLTSKF